MIHTLLFTIVIECVVVVGYCVWRTKPTAPILLTSIFANVITQSLLWIGLNLFFQYYLITLFIAEILIWVIESVLLHLYLANQLDLKESALLSLMMNLTSFGIGWFLPV